MVDLNLDSITQDVEKFKQTINGGIGLESLTLLYSKLTDEIDKLSKESPKLVSKLADVKTEVSSLMQGAEKLVKMGFKEILEQFKETGDSADDTSDRLEGMVLKLGLLTVAANHLPQPTGLSKIGEAARSSTNQLEGMLKAVTDLYPGIKNFPLMPTLEKDLVRADFARNAETGLLRAAAASGQFSEMMKSMNGNFSGLTGKVNEFSKSIYDTAFASGISSDLVGKYATELSTIPGALDNFNGANGQAVQGMSQLDAVIKTALGTGQDVDHVIGKLKELYDTFGTKGNKALEEVARMSSVADSINLPLDTMQKYTMDSAKAFALLGDNTQGAITIMARFGQAFKDSNLGPEGISHVVSGITQGIASMGIASRAFVSAQSGGPGGLQGAFDLTYKMQQGKTDEVYKQVETALKKALGGKLTTLDQARSNQGDAAALTKEISLLKSSAFGNIAKDDNSAIAIANALASGKTQDLSKITSPDKSLSDAMKIGNKFEEHQSIGIDKLNAGVQRLAQIQSIVAWNTAKDATKGLSKFLEQASKESELSGEHKRVMTGTGIHAQSAKDIDKSLVEEGNKAYDKIGDAFKQFIGIKDKQEPNKTAPSIKTNQTTQQTYHHQNLVNQHVMSQALPKPSQGVASAMDRAQSAGNVASGGSGSASNKNINVNVQVDTTCANCMRDIAHEVSSYVAEDQVNEAFKSSDRAATFSGSTGKSLPERGRRGVMGQKFQ